MIFCSLFNGGTYALEGWVCHYTLFRHCSNLKFYLLCMDDEVWIKANEIGRGIIPIHISDVEKRYPQLPSVRSTRSLKEYIVSFKPFLPEYIFDIYGEKKLFFVDSDIAFFNDPFEMFKELGQNAVLVKGHELVPQKAAGNYNVGVLGYNDIPECREWLSWWQERVIEWCYWRADPKYGFAEQGYLDVFDKEPNKFKKIHITPHSGINLAPWNILKHPLSVRNNTIYAGNNKLICYHYHEFELLKNSYHATGWQLPTLAKSLLYEPYYKLVLRSKFNKLWEVK